MMQTQDRQGREGIYSINLESGVAELLLARPPESGLQPGGWLDDGTWFYEIEYLESHEYSIFRVDPGATGGGREIHSIHDRSFGGRIMALQVSPQRDLLAFRVLGNQEIWVLPIEGGEARRLFQSPEGGWPGSVNWTPDGEALIAVVYSPKRPERQGLYRIPIDGSPTTRMDLLAESMQSISIHPDGRTILYRAGGPDPRLWKMENYWSPGTEPGATE